VWCIDKNIRYADKYKPTDDELNNLKLQLRNEIIKLSKNQL